jgi:hypothetical protein
VKLASEISHSLLSGSMRTPSSTNNLSIYRYVRMLLVSDRITVSCSLMSTWRDQSERD